MEKICRQRGKPYGKENIPALERAGNDAERLRENPNKDLSRAGQTVGRIVNKLIEMRKEQRAKEIRDTKGSKKIFYTSAQASVVEDD
jgi:hypothetical protein